MKSIVSAALFSVSMLAASSVVASINNVTVSVNGSAGPITLEPSSSASTIVTGDITNDGAAPSAWASTGWEFTGGSSSGCSEQPDPDVTPAAAATSPGTANISGMTAPATEGTYPLLFIAYDSPGCTGDFIGLPVITVTVAAAPPVVTQPTPVPALPLGGIIVLGVLLLLLARRKLVL